MFLVGIAGGTASGKTTLVNVLLAELGSSNVSVLTQDNYYLPTHQLTKKERACKNFDQPSALDFDLMNRHLEALQKGETIQQPQYSFSQHNRLTKTTPTFSLPILIIEGLFILNPKWIKKAYDLSVFLEISKEEQWKRKLFRDVEERGRTEEEVKKQYQYQTWPMQQQEVLPTKKYAKMSFTSSDSEQIALLIKSLKTQVIS